MKFLHEKPFVTSFKIHQKLTQAEHHKAQEKWHIHIKDLKKNQTELVKFKVLHRSLKLAWLKLILLQIGQEQKTTFQIRVHPIMKGQKGNLTRIGSPFIHKINQKL